MLLAALLLAGALASPPERALSLLERYKRYSTGGLYTGPFFDPNSPNNITTQLGTHAYLPCKVKQLGNKSVKYVQARDQGEYECQVSTEPKMSHFVTLNVVEVAKRKGKKGGGGGDEKEALCFKQLAALKQLVQIESKTIRGFNTLVSEQRGRKMEKWVDGGGGGLGERERWKGGGGGSHSLLVAGRAAAVDVTTFRLYWKAVPTTTSKDGKLTGGGGDDDAAAVPPSPGAGGAACQSGSSCNKSFLSPPKKMALAASLEEGRAFEWTFKNNNSNYYQKVTACKGFSSLTVIQTGEHPAAMQRGKNSASPIPGRWWGHMSVGLGLRSLLSARQTCAMVVALTALHNLLAFAGL
ncbi:hypothetical protein FOCC_FOCC004728 [Frankliniella occidentalis]|nr:hypothetical protein FOCC_FOCC004728 [Frankliniella occidentalis]